MEVRSAIDPLREPVIACRGHHGPFAKGFSAMRRFALLLLLVLLPVLTASCAILRRDRCYLAETRYIAMRNVFEQTGSYQRVAQAMDDEQWATCEINQFRYRLRKDLGMAQPEYDRLFFELEPAEPATEFEPGRVEKAIQ